MKQLRGIELKRFLKKTRSKQTSEIVLVLENIQYARNVAEAFRIADAFAVRSIYLTGISHHPPFGKDLKKVSRSKEQRVKWNYEENTQKVFKKLKEKGYKILALEVTDVSQNISKYSTDSSKKIALIAGSEVYGITKKTLDACDEALYIPMQGKGASFNVSVATAIALSHLA